MKATITERSPGVTVLIDGAIGTVINSYSSALFIEFELGIVEELPPATRTLPLLRSVAVC